jgi:hypothetical protein
MSACLEKPPKRTLKEQFGNIVIPCQRFLLGESATDPREKFPPKVTVKKFNFTGSRI